MSKKIPDQQSLKVETRLAISGREFAEHGAVNPAVYHASTITFPTTQSLVDRSQDYTYGRKGTPTSRAVETAIASLEGGLIARFHPQVLQQFQQRFWRF